MKRKLLAVLLTGTMLSGLLAGCGQEETPESVAGSDVVETVNSEATETQQEEVVEDITYPLADAEDLTWWVQQNFSLQSEFTDYTQSPFHTGLSEQTGVNIEWSFPAVGADKNTAYNLIWQEEKLPNIIFSNTVTVTEGDELLADGLIYDLTEYLPTYAPDFWELIHRPEYEDALKLMTTTNGSFFGFPCIHESGFGLTTMGPIIRTDWLKECDLEAPVTFEDWEKVLVAFKEKYNCAPFSPLIVQLRMVGLASGAGAYGSFNYKYYEDDNGNVQFAQVQDEYKEYLATLNKWYEMGLIDTDFTTANANGVRAKALNNEVGISFGATSLITNLNKDAEAEKTGAVYEAMEYPRTAPGEPTTFIHGQRAMFQETGYTMITTSCSEEELITALKLLNYGYTEEGSMYWNFGTENVSYTLDSNGDAQWTELLTGDPAGLTEGIKKYANTGSGPQIKLDHYKVISNSEAGVAALSTWTENTVSPAHTLPAAVFTEEESVIFTDKNAAIETYVQTMSLKFITGEESLDNWDAYVAEINKLGLEECIKAQQASLDRRLGK